MRRQRVRGPKFASIRVHRHTVIAACALAALLAGAPAVWWSLQIYSGEVTDKVHEPETRWWTNENECVDWDIYYYSCTKTRSVCSGTGENRTCRSETYSDTCSDTYCARRRFYEQEHIDDPDWILHVFGEDWWGNSKLKRVYVSEVQWNVIPRGFWWDSREIPDEGDPHRKGAQRSESFQRYWR